MAPTPDAHKEEQLATEKQNKKPAVRAEGEAGQQSPLELGLYPSLTSAPSQSPPAGALPDVIGLVDHGPLDDGETVTLPSGTTIHNDTVRLDNGLTTDQSTITLPGQPSVTHAPQATQGISSQELGGLFGTDAGYTVEQRDRDLALVSGQYIGPVTEEVRIAAQDRLNAHWRGGLWLADGSTILPDNTYGAAQIAGDLGLASTEGSLDPRSEQLRQQAQERLQAHRYALAAQSSDQIEARYTYMPFTSPDRQRRIDELVESGVPRDQADEVLWQRSMAARARLTLAGIPIDPALGDKLADQGVVAPASEFGLPALDFVTPKVSPDQQQSSESGPDGVRHALVPGGSSVLLQLAIPGLLAGATSLSPEAAAAVLGTAVGGSAAGATSVGVPALGAGIEPAVPGPAAAGGLTAAAVIGTVMSLVVANGGFPVQPLPDQPLIGPNEEPRQEPSVEVPWSQLGSNPWTPEKPGPTSPHKSANSPAPAPPSIGIDAEDGVQAAPGAASGPRPNPADDPATVSETILFPSAKPGQPGVPMLGTYWEGNSLKWAKDNPAGMPPNTYVSQGKSEISLKARLFELGFWSLDDLDEEYRPPVMAAMAALVGARLWQDMRYAELAAAGGPDAGIGNLTGSTEEREAELRRLSELGIPVTDLDKAVDRWWKAKAVVDRAKELLGEAGAVALLRSDGWDVNVRPKGDGTHDVVAAKDGQLLVVEAKGGDRRGKPRLGDALVPDGPGSPSVIRAQQMTDPYLWGKLKEDAANNPDFKQWLVDQGVWDAVQNEDPTRVGYRLAKTDAEWGITVYGSSQQPVGSGIPGHTVIGKTTGNRPGSGPLGPNTGPLLKGISQPLPLTSVGSEFGHHLIGVPPAASATGLDDLIQRTANDLAALAGLVGPAMRVNPARSNRKVVNQSLTFTITPRKMRTQAVSRDEYLRCLTFQ